MEQRKLKLNTKRTVYVGLGFFIILMMMQVYNNYCSVFLEKLGVSGTWTGILMALDNILAIFMLPIFGNLSDKTKCKIGRRTIYIIIGVLISSLALPFTVIAYLGGNVTLLIVAMGFILIAINTYRAPCVALMPDVTPKPLRSKANAIINLVGYAGGIVTTLLYAIFGGTSNKEIIWIPFVIVSVLALAVLVVFLFKVKENKIIEEMKEEMEYGEQFSETDEKIEQDKPLGKQNKFNLIVLLISVFLWKFAFNAIETFGANFANHISDNDSWWGLVSTAMIAVSIMGFIPAGKITEKLGRKKTVVLGSLMMLLGLLTACVITLLINSQTSGIIFLLPIVPLGLGWAWINVNSYTMVVELSTKQNVGKFTGYYYLFSNLAETLTPVCMGIIRDIVGNYTGLFIYSTFVMDIAIIVFLLYKNTKQEISQPKNNRKFKK